VKFLQISGFLLKSRGVCDQKKTIQNGGGPTKNFTGASAFSLRFWQGSQIFFQSGAMQMKVEPERNCQNFLKIVPEICINYSILYEFLQKYTGTVLRSFAISKRLNCIRKLA
jgi:hypothetical protein